MPHTPFVRLLVTSRGNEFMRDIAGTFAMALRAEGAACEVAVDEAPHPDAPDRLQLVVAPHEYFPLFLARELGPSQLDAACGLVHVLNVEQPGSPWFDLALTYARRCRGAFDIDRESTTALRRHGIRARYAPLGYVEPPGADGFARPSDRPVDVLFFGHSSRRRDRFFAAHAETFSRFNCRFVFTDLGRPRTPDTAGYVSGDGRSALLGSSTILLNIHSSDRRYFETHRALLALSHQCLLVSESSRGSAPLRNGTHFVMAPLHELPALCDALLDDPDRLNALAASGHAFARDEMNMRGAARTLMTWAEPAGWSTPPAESPQASDDEQRLAMIGRLETSLAARASGAPDWTVEDNDVQAGPAPPAVSVVVTVYNYEQFIAPCLDSVLASDAVDGGMELVVVDDASTDDSVAVARGAIRRASIPARLIRKATNTGLADARNVGTALARGEYIFTLDADNLVYPSCLRVLSNTLKAGGVAAVYGQIQRFDDDSDEALGLMSQYAWSVSDLVRSPYIDAMALFRRDVLVEVGGYSTELIEHGWLGWEDYDLWLTLAASGHECTLVPQVLSAYRVHDASMLVRTNRGSAGLAKHFRRKFRALVEQHPDLDRYFGFPVDGGAAGPPRPAPVEHSADSLAARCEELEGRLAAMYLSWSWRVTAPLRWVFRLLTGRA